MSEMSVSESGNEDEPFIGSPLAGSQSRVTDTNDTFEIETTWDKIKFLFKPYHGSVADDGHKLYSFVLLPETYYLYALLYFWFFFIVCIVVTLLFSEDYDPDDNPIKHRDGYNVICVYFDFSPSTEFALILFIPFLIFFSIFCILDLMRVYYAQKTDNFITLTAYKWYKFLSIFVLCSFLLFTETLSVDPFTSVILHTIPYLLLIIGLWLTNGLQIYYYYKVKLFNEYKDKYYKAFKVGLNIYIVVLSLVIFYKMVWSTLNLIGYLNEDLSYLHLSARYPKILPFGRCVEFLFMLLVAILPLPIKIMIAHKLKDKCVKLTLNCDIKHDDLN